MLKRNLSTKSNDTHTTVELPTTVGLDLSDRVSHFHVQRGDGAKIEAGKVATTPVALKPFFERWQGCRVVIEAGTHSPWISRLAVSCCVDIVVANPRQVELISKSDRKSDIKDAELLAEIGRTNPALLSPITHRAEAQHAHLAVLRARDTLVKVRTEMINHVRCVLKSNGFRAPSVSPESFGMRVLEHLPLQLEAALSVVARQISGATASIKQLDKQIEELCRTHYPITQKLQQVDGVGPTISLTFVLTIGDPTRFSDSRDVGAYLGLVPRRKSSGDFDPQLSITKAGDRQMRRLLVLAANYILGRFGPDCDLRRFGLKIAGSTKDKRRKKRAKVAVARKLAVLLHHLWTHDGDYDRMHLANKHGDPSPA
jgi:transposase